MNFTKDSRTIRAIFDSPVDYEKEKPPLFQDRGKKGGSFYRTFKVGLVTYSLRIKEDAEVSFQISDIATEPKDQFIKLMTESYNNNFKEGYQLDWEEALRYRRDYLLGMGSEQVVGTGGALKVFGTILRVVQEFIVEYRPKYLIFTIENPKQVNFYEKMIHQIKNVKNVLKKSLYNREVFQVFLGYR